MGNWCPYPITRWSSISTTHMVAIGLTGNVTVFQYLSNTLWSWQTIWADTETYRCPLSTQIDGSKFWVALTTTKLEISRISPYEKKKPASNLEFASAIRVLLVHDPLLLGASFLFATLLRHLLPLRVHLLQECLLRLLPVTLSLQLGLVGKHKLSSSLSPFSFAWWENTQTIKFPLSLQLGLVGKHTNYQVPSLPSAWPGGKTHKLSSSLFLLNKRAMMALGSSPETFNCQE